MPVGGPGGEGEGSRVDAGRGEHPVGVDVGGGVDPHVLGLTALPVDQEPGLAEGAVLEEHPRPPGAADGSDAHGGPAVDGGDDPGVLRVPAEPHDVRVLRLRHDVVLLARLGSHEGVVGACGGRHEGGVADAQHRPVGVPPHGVGTGVVAQGDAPLPVHHAGADVHVPGADNCGLGRRLLVGGDRLIQGRVVRGPGGDDPQCQCDDPHRQGGDRASCAESHGVSCSVSPRHVARECALKRIMSM